MNDIPGILYDRFIAEFNDGIASSESEARRWLDFQPESRMLSDRTYERLIQKLFENGFLVDD